MEMPEDGVWWLNYSQYEDLRLYEVGIQRCAPFIFIWTDHTRSVYIALCI